jgi:hypothetical protein
VDFHPTEEQQALLGALGKILAQTKSEAVDGRRSFFSATLDAALEDSGLLDAAGLEEFGIVAAALLVDEVSRLPVVVEAGASAMVRPLVCPEAPRPLAVLAGAIDRPARFLCEARSVLFVGAREARIATLEKDDCASSESFFAYPMGRLLDPDACYARARPCGDASEVRRLLQIAIACEISGALQGALDCVTEHVKNRRQFGRPLGAFQAVQHRLAGSATNIVASRLLARKAADLGRVEDAQVALGYAQDCAPRVLYDLHQFMGAMGLTLEHPLYRWSYRVKLLLSELGGASRQLRDVAGEVWSTAVARPVEADGQLQ